MGHNYEGTLIVFEGTDGTGKSTQMKLLYHHLTTLGYDVIATREPTEGQWGQTIRKLYLNREQYSPTDELELFINDRKEHVETLLHPQLQKGKIVLCDRYFLSTVAYQGALGFNIQELFDANSFAPQPDLALLFRASPQTGVSRIIGGRGEQPNDFEKKEYLTKVAKIFDSLCESYIQQVDASQSIEDVHQQVLAFVIPLLNKGPQPE